MPTKSTPGSPRDDWKTRLIRSSQAASSGKGSASTKPGGANSIEYQASVENDFKHLDPPARLRVVNAIEQSLSQSKYPGIPLKGEYKGMFKLRVGDYRVIYKRTPTGVRVARIAHRREAYR